MSYLEISPQEYMQKSSSVQGHLLIDVRTPEEYAASHLKGAINMPVDQLEAAKVKALQTKGQEIYLVCQSGGRSARAAEALSQAGMSPLFSIRGGTPACAAAGVPTEGSGRQKLSLDEQFRVIVGTFVFLLSMLGYFYHPFFTFLCILLGGGLVTSALTHRCGLQELIRKLPWNK